MSDQVIQDSKFAALECQFRGGIGDSVVHLRETSSTMNVAKKMVKRSTDVRTLDGKVIIADDQYEGRGRFGRVWDSEPGANLLLSVILCPRLALTGQITIMASLAAAMTVDELTDYRTAIKWPNDVMVRGKKICGVIAESFIVGDSFAGILGIGLNVNWVPPRDRRRGYLATSVRELNGSSIFLDRVQALRSLLTHLNELYDALERGETIVPEWRQKLETLGEEIQVTMLNHGDASAGESIHGIAEDVDEFGRLLIREPSGTVRAVAAGEVTARKDPVGR